MARIIPVPYSPLNASTPTTPITSWANKRPSRLADTPAAAELAAETWYGVPDPAIAAPRPTISTTALSPHHQVERSARSLVHSARTTRTWVTGPATVAGTGAEPAGPGQDGAHRVAPAWYSMLSWVTCMNASSSEAWVGVSSYTGR